MNFNTQTEALAFSDLVEWVFDNFGCDTRSKTVGSLIQACAPHTYFHNEASAAPATRLLLCRLVDLSARLQRLGPPTSGPVLDIFESEDLKGPGLWAYCDEGPITSIGGTVESWVYHCLVNGFVHPTTRQVITGFGFIGTFGRPDIPEIFQMCYKDLVNELEIKLEIDNSKIIYSNLVRFEEEYGITDDRSLSLILNPEEDDDDDESLFSDIGDNSLQEILDYFTV